MIAKNITISKNEILNKYSNLDEKVKAIIEKLYEIEYELTNNMNIREFNLCNDFLKNPKSNNEFNKYKNKTGVYIFLKDNIPVYIGFGGSGTTQDLKKRIENQFSAKDNNYSNLVYKIIKVEKSLDYDTLKHKINDIDEIMQTLQSRKEYFKKPKNARFCKSPEIDFNRLQCILLGYTSSLIVIDCGEKEYDNIKFAQALEVILIALFNSKYNG